MAHRGPKQQLRGGQECDWHSAQGRWLRRDSTAHRGRCTLATSNTRSTLPVKGYDNPKGKALLSTLYNYHTDVILNGHAHRYERFARITPSGERSSARRHPRVHRGDGWCAGRDSTRAGRAPRASQEGQRWCPRLRLGGGFYHWKYVPVEVGTTPTLAGTVPLGTGASPSCTHPKRSWSAALNSSGAMWHDRVGEKQTCRSAAPERPCMAAAFRDQIDQEYAQPLDIEALARGAHMSAGHLSRQFGAPTESRHAYLMTAHRARDGYVVATSASPRSASRSAARRWAPSALASPSWSVCRASIGTRRRARRQGCSCVAKQVTRPIRNREVRARSRK